AITQMQTAVDAVKETAGSPSCEYAKGLFNLAMLHIAGGDMAKGAEDCRLAADSCPDSSAGRKDRLMYLMNAGQLLSRADQTDAAIQVLETSLHEREQAYGPEHAGTAYGQQALAEVFLSAGRFGEGLELSEKALQTFHHEGHHEYPSALATTTALASASGLTADEIWGFVGSETTGVIGPLIDSAMVLAESMPDSTGMRYLRQLSDWAGKHLPPDATPMMNIVALWSNIASERGNNEERQRSIERAVETARQLGDPAVVVNALEGRALMFSDTDASPEQVRIAYQDALDHAIEHGLQSDSAGVLRNWALYESDVGFEDQADQRFREALVNAEASGDEEMLARTQIAYGIFHQHHDRNPAAAPLLESGIEALSPAHPDAACGVLHQVALAENLTCPCKGDLSIAQDALSKLAERFFSKSGLDDIIESVTCGSEDEDGKGLQVQLSREPSQQEIQRLQIAHGVFQNLLGQSDAGKR
ncbi:MAG: hypothetical protein AB8B91_09350, partial [Rubripirellula sp.]